MKKKVIIILLILTIPAAAGLFHRGFFVSHDADWMVIRLSAFHQSLRDGHFPVRWTQRLNHGFGYPVLNFLYPLPFYFAEIFYLGLGSLTLATKLVFIVSFFASAVTMYLWLRNKFKTLPSLAGALLYVYTPYRFVDTYVRGSIGESLAFVFVPLLFLAIDILPKKPKKGVILGTLAAAATLLAHNVFVMFLGLAFVYGIVTLPKKRLKTLVGMFFLSATISAYFWLPALVELKYVSLSQIQVTNATDHLVTLKQLILPSWGYGPADPRGDNSLSFQLGLVNLAVIIAASWLIFKRKTNKTLAFFIATFFIAVLMLHRVSAWLWQLIPGISIIQFPWRLLSVTTFASATLAAAVATSFKKNIVAVAIIAAALLLTVSYARPKEYRLVPDSFFATNEASTTTWDEYLPIWVESPPTQRSAERFTITRGQATVSLFEETNVSKTITVEAKEPTSFSLASLYYPGWQARINGQSTPIHYAANNGLIAFELPPGKHEIKVEWQETPLRKFANTVSTLTFVGLLSFSIFSRPKLKNQ